MELAQGIVLDIESTSQRVITAATAYSRRTRSKNVQPCHFRLEREMQMISVAAKGMLGVLSEPSLPDGPPLNDQLQKWFSTDDPPACLDTLNQMERMLQSDTWMNSIFSFVHTLHATPPEDKINAAVRLFDLQRNHFHFLLTTNIWNWEEPRQKSQPMQGDPESPTREIDNQRKLNDILQWLDGLSCNAKQENTLSLRQPGTCAWLNSTPEYKSWRNNDDSFLWLQGKPGSGKTVLASFVVDSLKSKQYNGETLAYFYCDFQNDRSTSAAEVMRSLLSQLLCPTRNGNIGLAALADDLVREKDSDTPILKNVGHLATFVSQIAKQFDHQPLVLVDALDECKDVEQLLDGLLILNKGGLRLFVTSRPLQIIKDGLRGLPFISMAKMADVVSSDIALHVTRELDSRRRLRDLELGFKMEIHSVLCDRADGMFRWVQCQVDTLNQCATRAEVREALNNLPIGLDETYRRILIAIDTGSPEGKLALRALMWLVGALRPFRLLEILDGLTLNLARQIMDPDDGPMHRGVLLDACSSLVTYDEDTDILTLSHFSVKEYLTGDSTRINLPQYHINYQGAHEHLARLCICYVTLYLKHVYGSGEQTLLHRIMRTIEGRSHNTTRQWSHFPGNPTAVLSMSQEFLKYVFTNGFNHLAYLGLANHAVLKEMVVLQLDIQQYRIAWERICRMSQREGLSVPWPDWQHDFMLYILVAFASDSLLCAFLDHGRIVPKRKDQINPLIYAAHFGKAQHARLLLSRGAKVNERGLVIDSSRWALPLEVAVSRQHHEMVDLLLSTGSIVPKWLFTFSTSNNFPIRIARRLLQTDEFTEWAAESGNRLPSPVGLLERLPPLVYERDIIVMLRKLVQVGLDPAARNSTRKTALDLAIAGGYQAVMVYLILAGAPIPANFMSVVSRTTRSKRMPILRLIVDTGAAIGVDVKVDPLMAMKILEQDECLQMAKNFDPFGLRKLREKLLHVALDRGFPLLATHLLSTGRSLPPDDALFAILRSALPSVWRAQTICSLVGRGAGLSDGGNTLLHATVLALDEHQCLKVAKLLVPMGCDPFKHSEYRRMPLDIALDRKFPLLADYLLSTGRPLPHDTFFAILHSALPATWRAQTICSLVGKGAETCGLSDGGNTLLHAIVLALNEHLGLDVAKLLVGAGCCPLIRNKADETPLHIALKRGYSSIADYLLLAGKPSPTEALFAVLTSRCSMSWIVENFYSLTNGGADIHSTTAEGDSLIHVVMMSHSQDMCLELLRHLVSQGCNLSARDRENQTALHIAVEQEFVSVIEYILSLDQSLPDDILFSVLKRGPFEPLFMLRILIDRGANVHATMDGDTLLHVAISSYEYSCSLPVVEILVDAGCDAFATNSCGKTPLHLAVALKAKFVPDVVKYLLSTTTPGQPSLPADILACTFDGERKSWKDTHTILQLLIEKGANVHVRAANGGSLLHLAIGQFQRLQILLQNLSRPLSPPLSRPPDLSDHPTLSSITEEPPSEKIVPASLNARPTSYHQLHSMDKPKAITLLTVIEILVDSGCDPIHCDASGHPPVHYALLGGHVDVVEYLLPRTFPLPQNLRAVTDLAPQHVQARLRNVLTRWRL